MGAALSPGRFVQPRWSLLTAAPGWSVPGGPLCPPLLSCRLAVPGGVQPSESHPETGKRAPEGSLQQAGPAQSGGAVWGKRPTAWPSLNVSHRDRASLPRKHPRVVCALCLGVEVGLCLCGCVLCVHMRMCVYAAYMYSVFVYCVCMCVVHACLLLCAAHVHVLCV